MAGTTEAMNFTGSTPGATVNSTVDPLNSTDMTTEFMSMNVTNMTTMAIPVLTEEAKIRNFFIGLILAVLASIFTGCSYIFKKLGLLKLSRNNSTRAGAGGYGYLKEWLWWAGMILMVSGELANFAAYAFAPATMVTPLGALSVLVSAVLSSRFLKEKLNLLGKLGCALCILGSTVIVLNSPHDQEVESMEDLIQKLPEPGFIIIAILFLGTALVCMFILAPRYGQKNVLVYIMICSTLGAFTVMGCKGIGLALTETVLGKNQFTNWLTYVLIFMVLVCILVQLNYLNKALDSFNTAIVTSIDYVTFTSCVILMSVILYKEWFNMDGKQIAADICGFITICIGMVLLQAFRHMEVSWRNLPKAKKEENGAVVLNGDVIVSENDIHLSDSRDELRDSLEMENECLDNYNDSNSYCEDDLKPEVTISHL